MDTDNDLEENVPYQDNESKKNQKSKITSPAYEVGDNYFTNDGTFTSNFDGE